MSEPLKVTHDGVEITYVEGTNQWTFQLRGRDRSAESLQKAKEAIEKPVSTKTKAFERIKVYIFRYNEWLEGEVTSVAEGRRWSGSDYVWFVHGKNRSKETSDTCFPMTEENTKKIQAHMKCLEDIRALEEKKRAILDSIKPLVIAKEEV